MQRRLTPFFEHYRTNGGASCFGIYAAATDPAAFFSANDLKKSLNPTPPRRPWRGGGLLMGAKNL
jgi:hypothetical protein